MAPPSECRWEFQQVDSEYIKKAERRRYSNALGFGNSNIHYMSAYRALSMAENRAAFSLRRRRSLGFSK